MTGVMMFSPVYWNNTPKSYKFGSPGRGWFINQLLDEQRGVKPDYATG